MHVRTAYMLTVSLKICNWRGTNYIIYDKYANCFAMSPLD